MANNSANPDIVLNENANQRQENRKQNIAGEESNIENDEENHSLVIDLIPMRLQNVI